MEIKSLTLKTLSATRKLWLVYLQKLDIPWHHSSGRGQGSVNPGVGVQAVVLPQLATIGWIAVDHRQCVGQESCGCWVFWPAGIHLTCGTKEDKVVIQEWRINTPLVAPCPSNILSPPLLLRSFSRNSDCLQKHEEHEENFMFPQQKDERMKTFQFWHFLHSDI